MSDNKKRLHELIDSISSEGISEYLVTFITLFLEKWGGVRA